MFNQDTTLASYAREPTQITSMSLLQFMDISPDALAIINQAGIIVMVNRQAGMLFGYPHEELLDQKIEILLPQRFRGTHIAHREGFFSLPLARPMGAGLRLFGLHKDNTEFPVDISLRPLLLDGVLHIISAIRDVTEQKLLEGQLQRQNEELKAQYQQVQAANRLKSEFLANMSHELLTPLNGIIGFSKMLHKEMVGPISEPQREYLGDILSSSTHLLQLINDILELARVEVDKMTFEPETIDMKSLVSEVQEVLRPLLIEKRLECRSSISAALSKVVIDPVKFKQVLYNYLSNAIKFTPDEGRIAIRILPEGTDAFRLEVEDSGIGINPEDLGRLFVEFQQLDTSMSKTYQGTGLGLALTRRVVEAQGGSVGVQSMPEQGSTFFARLPCVIASTQ